MYMDAKKLMNQKNYSMKHKMITNMEVEEIMRELQESQRSHLQKREEKEGELEHWGTRRNGEQKPEAAFQQKKKRKFINKGIRVTN